MNKPISPKLHGFLDYGFAGLLLVAPRLFRLNKTASNLAYGFGTYFGIYSAFTDYPAGIYRRIPLRVHEKVDKGNLAALLLLPAATGAMKQRNARLFYFGIFLAGLTTVMLTDWEEDL